MVDIVTGQGIGLFNTTDTGLGKKTGVDGNGESIAVNAATGNLVIQRQDEFLVGNGFDTSVLRTYNSLGQFNDDNGDNFRFSFSRELIDIENTVSTEGSTLTRVGRDGSKTQFTYTDAAGAYTSTDGSGAHDHIVFEGFLAIYTEGSSGAVEHYGFVNGLIKLTNEYDALGNHRRFDYNADGLVSFISTSDGRGIQIDYYAGTQNVAALRSGVIDTGTEANPVMTSATTVTTYEYESYLNAQLVTESRLLRVITDLTPLDTVDTVTFQTVYGYDANNRLSSVTQIDSNSNNTQVQFEYYDDGGIDNGKVHKIISGADGSRQEISEFSYNLSGGTAAVDYFFDDGLSQSYELAYTAAGQVAQTTTPAVNGVALTTNYNYDGDGNLSQVSDTAGQRVDYRYDPSGNRTKEWDAEGNTVAYRYNSENRLLAETVYRIADPDTDGDSGTTAGFDAPDGALTTRYIYEDTGRQLRFIVAADGSVTEYRYEAAAPNTTNDKPSSTLVYTVDRYDVSGLLEADNITLAQMVEVGGWLETVDKTAVQRTDVSFDVLGEVDAITTFTSVDAASNGIAAGQSVTHFVYDQYGQLQSSLEENGLYTVYTYDGLGRVISTTLDPDTNVAGDERASVTTFGSDGGLAYTMTAAENGLQRYQIFDTAGRLVRTFEADGNSPAVLDALTDPTGVESLGNIYYIYDTQGRQIAEQNLLTGITLTFYDERDRVAATVDRTGALTEFTYDRYNNLLSRTESANRMANLQGLVDLYFTITPAAAATLKVDKATLLLDDLAIYRGVEDAANDRTEYWIYDEANRLRFAIDAAGYVTETLYDGVNQIIQTVEHGRLPENTQRATLEAMIDELNGRSFSVDAVNGYLDATDLVPVSPASVDVESIPPVLGAPVQQYPLVDGAKEFKSESPIDPEAAALVSSAVTIDSVIYPYDELVGLQQVAQLSNGNSVVVWQFLDKTVQDGNGRNKLYTRIMDSDGDFLTDSILVASTSYDDYLSDDHPEAMTPEVVAVSDGDFVIVWREPDATGVRQIFAKRFDAAGGEKEAAFLLNTNTAGTPPTVEPLPDGGGTNIPGDYVRPPTATVLDDGRTLVVWVDAAGDYKGRLLAIDGSLIGVDEIDFARQDLDGSGNIWYREGARPDLVSLGSDENGQKVLLTWRSHESGSTAGGLFASVYYVVGNSVTSASPDFYVNQVEGNAASGVRVIKLAGSNKVFFTWMSVDDEYELSLKGRVVDVDNFNSGSEFTISTKAESSTRTLSGDMVQLEDGSLVVTWLESGSVVGARFSEDGTLVGGPLHIAGSSHVTSFLSNFSVDAASLLVVDSTVTFTYSEGRRIKSSSIDFNNIVTPPLLPPYISSENTTLVADSVDDIIDPNSEPLITPLKGVSSGSALIVWRAQGEIFGQVVGGGGQLISTQLLLLDNSVSPFFFDPSVTALNDGGYYLTWGSSPYRYGQRFDSQGVSQYTQPVELNTVAYQGVSSKTIELNDGRLLTVWADSSAASVVGYLTSADGILLGSELIFYSGGTFNSGYQPDVVELSDSTILLAWVENNSIAHARTYDISGAQPIEQDSLLSSSVPDISASSIKIIQTNDGKTYIHWFDNIESRGPLVVNIIDIDNISSPLRLTTTDAEIDEEYLQFSSRWADGRGDIAYMDDGSFVVSWTAKASISGNFSANNYIYIARYAVDGTLIDGPFPIGAGVSVTSSIWAYDNKVQLSWLDLYGNIQSGVILWGQSLPISGSSLDLSSVLPATIAELSRIDSVEVSIPGYATVFSYPQEALNDLRTGGDGLVNLTMGTPLPSGLYDFTVTVHYNDGTVDWVISVEGYEVGAQQETAQKLRWRQDTYNMSPLDRVTFQYRESGSGDFITVVDSNIVLAEDDFEVTLPFNLPDVAHEFQILYYNSSGALVYMLDGDFDGSPATGEILSASASTPLSVIAPDISLPEQQSFPSATVAKNYIADPGSILPGASLILATSPTRVDNDYYANHASPKTVKLTNGNSLVVWDLVTWDSESQSIELVVAQLFDSNGDSIGNPIEIPADSSNGYSDSAPEAVPLPNGEFLVLWTDFAIDTEHHILAQRYDALGVEIGLPYQLDDADLASAVSATVLENGQIFATWYDYSLGGLYGHLFDSNGSPIDGAIDLSQMIGVSIPGSSEVVGINPTDIISLPGSGLGDEFLVTWQQGASINAATFRLVDGSVQLATSSFLINNPAGVADVYGPRVVYVQASNSVFFTWTTRSWSGYKLDGAAAFLSDIASVTEFTLAESVGVTSQYYMEAPGAIAVLPDGTVVVAWSQATGYYSVHEIVITQYTSSGVQMGSPLVVGSTDGANRAPSIRADGNVVEIVWLMGKSVTEGLRSRRVLFTDEFSPSIPANIVGGNVATIDNTLYGNGSPKIIPLKGVNNGKSLVTWSSTNSTETYAQILGVNGEPSGFRIDIDVDADKENAITVAALSDGGFYIKWDGMYGRRYDYLGVLQSAEHVDPSGTNSIVTALEDGRILVVDSTTDALYGTVLTVDGVVDIPRFQLDGFNFTNSNDIQFSVLALPGNEFLLSWTDNISNDHSDYYARRYRMDVSGAEALWSQPIHITSALADFAHVETHLAADGDLVMVWFDAIERTGIVSVRIVKLSAPDSVVTVEIPSKVAGIGTEIHFGDSALLDDGSVVVTWVSKNSADGSWLPLHNDVYMARYTQSGELIDGPFAVGTTGTASPSLWSSGDKVHLTWADETDFIDAISSRTIQWLDLQQSGATGTSIDMSAILPTSIDGLRNISAITVSVDGGALVYTYPHKALNNLAGIDGLVNVSVGSELMPGTYNIIVTIQYNDGASDLIIPLSGYEIGSTLVEPQKLRWSQDIFPVGAGIKVAFQYREGSVGGFSDIPDITTIGNDFEVRMPATIPATLHEYQVIYFTDTDVELFRIEGSFIGGMAESSIVPSQASNNVFDISKSFGEPSVSNSGGDNHVTQLTADLGSWPNGDIISWEYRLSGELLYRPIDPVNIALDGTAVLADLDDGLYEYRIFLLDDGETYEVTNTFLIAASERATSNNSVQLVDGSRGSRTYYDAAGRLVGHLDSEGYLTESVYNRAGQVVETIRYAITSPISLSLDIADLRPASSSDDQHQYFVYDGKGQRVAEVNAEGYVTEWTYNNNGQVTQEVGYSNGLLMTESTQLTVQDIASGTGVQVEGVEHLLLGHVQPTADTNADQVTRYGYTGFGELAWTYNALTGYGETYDYNSVGLLERTTSGEGTYVSASDTMTLAAAAMNNDTRYSGREYDVQGRVEHEYNRHTALDAGTDLNVDHFYDDLTGLRTHSVDVMGNATYFYYDETGSLRYAVNGEGQVVETFYNGFGQVMSSIVYDNTVDTTELKGGLLDGAALAVFDTLLGTPKRTTETTYTQRGQVATFKDAASFDADITPSASYSYNAFGEVKTLVQAIRDANTDIETRTTIYRHDKRGQLTSTEVAGNNLAGDTSNLLSSASYDAFGRVISATDANGNITTRVYDNLGRTLEVKDAVHYTASITYDAFDRVLTQTDALGNITTVTYDDNNRAFTTTRWTTQGDDSTKIQTVTSQNVHGEVFKVVEESGHYTEYNYDALGNLNKTERYNVSGALVTSSEDHYDAAGRLHYSIDGNGTYTETTYDGASRVLTVTIDPKINPDPLDTSDNSNGLALTTTYRHDTDQRRLETEDAEGNITRSYFDANGRIARIITDPDGLNLLTEYAYDAEGLQVTERRGTAGVTPASDVIDYEVEYQYDVFGRRSAEVIDPNGALKLTTTYSYDKNSNMVARTDANLNTTYFAYNARNEKILSVDPLGYVSEARYDGNGRVTDEITYSHSILDELSAWVDDIVNAGRLAPTAREINDFMVQYTVANGLYNQQLLKNADANDSAAASWGGGDWQALEGTNAEPNDPAFVGYVDYIDATVDDDRTLDLIETGFSDSLVQVVDLSQYSAGTALSLSLNQFITNVNIVPRVILEFLDGAGELVPDTLLIHDLPVANLNAWEVITLVPFDIPSGAVQVQVTVQGITIVGSKAAPVMEASPMMIDAIQLQALDPNAVTQANYQLATKASHVNYDYDDAGRRTHSIVDPDASGLQITTESVYDDNGNVIETIDANLDSTYYLYDAANRLSYTLDAEQYLHSFTYDRNGNLENTRDYLQPFTAVFNASNAAAHVSDSLSAQNIYDGASRLIYTLDAEQYLHRFIYDGNGNLEATRDYQQRFTNPSFTASTAAAHATDTLDSSSHIDYDAAGRRTRIYESDLVGAKFEEYGYDAAGNRTSIKDKAGNLTTFSYDNANRLFRSFTPRDDSSVAQVDRKGYVVEYHYDAQGNVKDEIVYGDEIELYSGNTRLTAATIDEADLKDSRTTSYTYDDANRLKTTTVPSVGGAAGVVTQYDYDSAGNQTVIIEALDLPEERRTEMDYDVRGLVIEERHGVDAPEQITIRYTYDALGRRTGLIDPRGAELAERDTDWAKAMRMSLGYAEYAGEVTALKAELSALYTTTYEFDAIGRLTSETDPLGGVISSVYDGVGNLVKATDPKANSGYFYYDDLGRVSYQIDPEGYVTAYTYDHNDQVITQQRYQQNISAAGFDETTAQSAIAAELRPELFNFAGMNTTNLTVGYGTVSGGLVIEDGRAVFTHLNDADDTIPVVATTNKVTMSELASYQVEVSFEQANVQHLLVSFQNDQSNTDPDFRRLGVEFTNGVAQFHSTYGTQSADATTATTVTAGVRYIVELESDTAGITMYLYEKGQSRSDGWSHREDWTDWGDFQARVQGYVGPTETGGKSFLHSIEKHNTANTTSYSYNALGHLSKSMDAEGHAESYKYDANGNRTEYTDKNADKYYYEYNARSELVEETLPETLIYNVDVNGSGVMTGTTSQLTALKNTYQYDALGNKTQSREASNIALQTRVTDFVYDELGREVEAIGQGFSVDSGEPSVRPVTQKTYDAVGNIVQETVGAYETSDGVTVTSLTNDMHITLHQYDALNRRVVTVGPGTKDTDDNDQYGVFTFTYDAVGNIVEETNYAGLAGLIYTNTVSDRENIQDVIDGVTSTDSRSMYHTYNANNLRTSTYSDISTFFDIDPVVLGYATTGYYYDIYKTETDYDANGNIVRERDANFNETFSYYDRVGNKIAQLEAGRLFYDARTGYVTVWDYDAEGRLKTETRFSNEIVVPVQGAASEADWKLDSDNPLNWTASNVGSRAAGGTELDRITDYDYDGLGRLRLTTVHDVEYATVDGATGAVTPDLIAQAITEYQYDGNGNVLAMVKPGQDARSERTTEYRYDALNRLSDEVGPQFENYQGKTDAQTWTEYQYSAAGDTLSTEVKSEGLTAAIVKLQQFDAAGHLLQSVDGEGYATFYLPDQFGNIATQIETVSDGFGDLYEYTHNYDYDNYNREISRELVVTKNGGVFTAYDQPSEEVRYNVYGDITAKGVSGQFQERWEYDLLGRVFKTNAENGTWRVYIYDGNGNASIEASVKDVFTHTPAKGEENKEGEVMSSLADVLSPDDLYKVDARDIQLTVSHYNFRDQQIGRALPPMAFDELTSFVDLTSEGLDPSNGTTSEGSIGNQSAPWRNIQIGESGLNSAAPPPSWQTTSAKALVLSASSFDPAAIKADKGWPDSVGPNAIALPAADIPAASSSASSNDMASISLTMEKYGFSGTVDILHSDVKAFKLSYARADKLDENIYQPQAGEFYIDYNDAAWNGGSFSIDVDALGLPAYDIVIELLDSVGASLLLNENAKSLSTFSNDADAPIYLLATEDEQRSITIDARRDERHDVVVRIDPYGDAESSLTYVEERTDTVEFFWAERREIFATGHSMKDNGAVVSNDGHSEIYERNQLNGRTDEDRIDHTRYEESDTTIAPHGIEMDGANAGRGALSTGTVSITTGTYTEGSTAKIWEWDIEISGFEAYGAGEPIYVDIDYEWIPGGASAWQEWDEIAAVGDPVFSGNSGRSFQSGSGSMSVRGRVDQLTVNSSQWLGIYFRIKEITVRRGGVSGTVILQQTVSPKVGYDDQLTLEATHFVLDKLDTGQSSIEVTFAENHSFEPDGKFVLSGQTYVETLNSDGEGGFVLALSESDLPADTWLSYTYTIGGDRRVGSTNSSFGPLHFNEIDVTHKERSYTSVRSASKAASSLPVGWEDFSRQTAQNNYIWNLAHSIVKGRSASTSDEGFNNDLSVDDPVGVGNIIYRQQGYNAFGEIDSETDGQRERKHYTVQGDTLSSLALLYYGDSAQWTRIQTANGLSEGSADVLTADVALMIPVSGYTTNIYYNTLGKMTQKVSPETLMWPETSGAYRSRPTENYYYNQAGELVATKDANSNELEAGQQYYESRVLENGRVVREFDGEGYYTSYAYDVHGNMRKREEQINIDDDVNLRTQYYDYDKNNQLTTQTLERSHSGLLDISDEYAYDSMGNRITHINAESNSEKYSYDFQGRVRHHQSVGLKDTYYSYVYESDLDADLSASVAALRNTQIPDVGSIGTYFGAFKDDFGGYKKITTTTSNGLTGISNTLEDRVDYFDNIRYHKDYGNHQFFYNYNEAGWLLAQAGTTKNADRNDQLINYEYYYNGYVSRVVDRGINSYANFQYDHNGNRIYESYYDQPMDQENTQQHPYQMARADYDELNRLVRVFDRGNFDVRYGFDANSNRRFVDSIYHDGTLDLEDFNSDGSLKLAVYEELADTIGETSQTNRKILRQRFFYQYDKNDRFTITMGDGVFDGNGDLLRVERANTGYEIEYNGLDQRTAVQSDLLDGTGSAIYNADKYVYDDLGTVKEVWIYVDAYKDNIDLFPDSWPHGAGYVKKAERINDDLGRTKTYKEYSQYVGFLVVESQLATEKNYFYTADGSLNYETERLPDDHIQRKDYSYLADGLTLNDIVSSSDEENTAEITHTYSYIAWDNLKKSGVSVGGEIGGESGQYIDPYWINGQSDYEYDSNGHIKRMFDQQANNGQGRVIVYVNDQNGHVLRRDDITQMASIDTYVHREFYYLNGVGIGDVGNDDVPSRHDYAMTLALQDNSPHTNLRPRLSPVTSADFDQNFQPINPTYPALTPGDYVVQEGDTLQSIASKQWGDGSLWYLIADANGLLSDSSLSVGTRLTIPNVVANIHNTSETFRPYDAGLALGDTMPTLPDAPPPVGMPEADDGCGLKQILVVIIAVVVSVITYGALSEVVAWYWAAAAAGAAGSVASQVAGMALGTQDSFNWEAVAMSAATSVITAGVGHIPGLAGVGAAVGGSSTFMSNFAQAAANSVVSQGIGKVLGVREHFSWRSVAVAGAAAGTLGQLEIDTESTDWGEQLASAAITEGVQSAIFGDDFDFTSVAGNAIGNTLAQNWSSRPVSPAAQAAFDRKMAQMNQAVSDGLTTQTEQALSETVGSMNAATSSKAYGPAPSFSFGHQAANSAQRQLAFARVEGDTISGRQQALDSRVVKSLAAQQKQFDAVDDMRFYQDIDAKNGWRVNEAGLTQGTTFTEEDARYGAAMHVWDAELAPVQAVAKITGGVATTVIGAAGIGTFLGTAAMAVGFDQVVSGVRDFNNGYAGDTGLNRAIYYGARAAGADYDAAETIAIVGEVGLGFLSPAAGVWTAAGRGSVGNARAYRGQLGAVSDTFRGKPFNPSSEMLQPHAKKHTLSRILHPKSKPHHDGPNTVALASVDTAADVKAINAGEGMISDDGARILVNNREYGFHSETGRMFPIRGEGLVNLSAGEFEAVGVLNKFGNTPQAQNLFQKIPFISDQNSKRAIELLEMNKGG